MIFAVQVYKLSIGAACGLSWPSDRLVIQVLDDSTDPTVKVLLLLLSPFHKNIGALFSSNQIRFFTIFFKRYFPLFKRDVIFSCG